MNLNLAIMIGIGAVIGAYWLIRKEKELRGEFENERH